MAENFIDAFIECSMFDVQHSMFAHHPMSEAYNNVSPRFGETDWVSGRTLGLIIFAGILTIVMALVSPNFLTAETFFSQSRYVAFYLLVALSQAICLAIGDMNLAVGAVGSITTVALGLLIAPDHAHWSPWLAVPIVFLVGPLSGWLHG